MTGAVAPGQRPNAGIGCFGTLLASVVVVAVVALALFVGFIGLVIVGGLLVIGLLAWAVDRVLLAVSPKRRERRSQQGGVFVWRAGQFGQVRVIDAEAIDTTASEAPRSDGPEGDERRPGGTE